MKTLFTISLIAALSFLSSPPASAQTATPSTSLCAPVAVTDTVACLTSPTNVVAQTGLYFDLEYVKVLGPIPAGTSNVYVKIARAQASTLAAPHSNAQTVWIALTAPLSLVPGSNGFSLGASFGDYGTCTRSSQTYLPHIWPNRGEIIDCDATTGRWTPYNQTFTMAVPATNCNWGTTGTYGAQVAVATGGPNLQGFTVTGASLVPTVQISVTAATSANTLTCYVPVNTFQPLINKGVTVKYADMLYGVQTTTLTSISGGAFSTITFPIPAASETPSVVTPVAVGGAVTQSSSTGNMAATTAGAFYSSRLTPATPINLTTDMQYLVVSEAFNQSASAAEILQSPGMLLHYTVQQR